MPDGMEEIGWISKFWQQIIVAAGIVACWTRMEYKTGALHKMVLDRQTGKPTVVFLSDCEKTQTECQSRLAKAIEDLKQSHVDLSKKLSEEVGKLHTRIDETNRTLGQMPYTIIDLLVQAGRIKQKD